MRVLVCGSRTFGNSKVVHTILDGLHASEPDRLTLIEGGAQGADSIAARWAAHTPTVEHLTFLAEWRTHANRAGPIRNQRMLDEGKPELVVAFVNKPLEQSVGTFDMVRRARGAQVPVWVVEVKPVEPQRRPNYRTLPGFTRSDPDMPTGAGS